MRFNGERIKLYDNNKLTIVDAALRAGFPNEQLFPRRGREINFYVNGKKRIVRGEPGESAVVRVNGRVTSINATLEPNSDIVIEPSTMGEAAVCRLEELEEYGRVVITFEVNGRMITCPRFAEVNGSLEPPYYEIQENDWVEMRNFYTVAQIMEFMDVEIDMDSEILVNNKPADLDTMVYENFSVEWDVITYRTPPSEIENVYKRSEPLVMEEEAVSEPEPAEEPKPVKEEEAKVQPQPEPVKAEEPKPQPKPVKEEAKKTQPQPEPIKAEEPKPQPKPVKEEEAKAQSQPEPVKAEEPESLTEEPELSQEELEEKFIQSQQTAESDIRPTIIKKPEVKTVKAKPETVSLQVIVNNAAVTLTGKSSYVFVDVFDAISFDLNAGNGRAIVTRLNNAMPSYTAPLQYGDVIEIYWED